MELNVKNYLDLASGIGIANLCYAILQRCKLNFQINAALIATGA